MKTILFSLLFLAYVGAKLLSVSGPSRALVCPTGPTISKLQFVSGLCADAVNCGKTALGHDIPVCCDAGVMNIYTHDSPTDFAIDFSECTASPVSFSGNVRQLQTYTVETSEQFNPLEGTFTCSAESVVYSQTPKNIFQFNIFSVPEMNCQTSLEIPKECPLPVEKQLQCSNELTINEDCPVVDRFGAFEIASLTSGRIILAQDMFASPQERFAQVTLFEADGITQLNQFEIVGEADDLYPVRVIALNNGNFLVTYVASTINKELKGIIYDKDGEAVTSIIPLSETSPEGVYQVTALDNKFVVVFSAKGFDQAPESLAIVFKIFLEDGTPLSAETVANEHFTGDQFQPSVSALSDSNFVIAWTSTHDLENVEIPTVLAKVFGQDDQDVIFDVTEEELVFQTDQHLMNPVVMGLENFITIAADSIIDQQVVSRLLSNQLYPVAEFPLAQTTDYIQGSPRVTSLDEKSYMWTWENVDSLEILGRIFYLDLEKEPSCEFRISNSEDITSPKTAVLPNNRFLSVYTDGTSLLKTIDSPACQRTCQL